MLTLALTLPPQGPQLLTTRTPQFSNSRPSTAGFHAPSLAGGMGQVARAAVVYGKAVPTTTHKNSNRLSAEDRDAQCTHTRKAVEKT